MRALIALPLLAAITGCGPTCEQRGGQEVPHGFTTTLIVQPGGAVIPVMLPRYRCAGATS